MHNFQCLLHCVRLPCPVVLQEKTGNVLVFMSTVKEVTDLVDNLASQMQHDPQCCVRSMFSALDANGKKEVTDFDKLPQNKNKRLICVSTNVAEAGVTIPGDSGADQILDLSCLRACL